MLQVGRYAKRPGFRRGARTSAGTCSQRRLRLEDFFARFLAGRRVAPRLAARFVPPRRLAFFADFRAAVFRVADFFAGRFDRFVALLAFRDAFFRVAFFREAFFREAFFRGAAPDPARVPPPPDRDELRAIGAVGLPAAASADVARRAGVVAGMVKGLGGGGAAGIGSLDSGESSIQPPLVHPVSISSSPGIGAPLLAARHDPPPGQAPKRRCERVVPV